MNLTALTRSAVRVTFDWDLHFLSKDDVDLANAAARIWDEQRDIEVLWPSRTTPDISEHFEERVRSGLTLISTQARSVAERVVPHPEFVRSDADIRTFREASKALERLWMKLAKLTNRQSGIANPANSTPAAVSVALGEAERALPASARGVSEPFGFIQRLHQKHGGKASGADVQHQASRIARKWARYRRDRHINVQESLGQMCAQEGLDRTACKIRLVEQVLQKEAGLIDRPQFVRKGQQWLKRERPGGEPRKSRVWLEDQCPYLLWRWYGNQVIGRAGELIASQYPATGTEREQTGEGPLEAALSARAQEQSGAVAIFETMKLVEQLTRKAALSPRQAEVFKGYAQHERGVDIAGRLRIAPSSVYAHLHRARAKLAQIDRSDLL